MRKIFSISGACVVLMLLGVPGVTSYAFAQAEAAQQAPTPTKTRAVGVVKAVSANSITLQTDAGSEMTVTVQPSTRLLRMEPGQTDLKSAPAIQLSDVQVGDRMLVAGTPAGDGKSITASSAVVMKKADVAEKQQRDREAWQKNGVSGTVKSIDVLSSTIVISVGVMKANTLTVHVTPATVVRRYPPNSWNYDDSKPAALADVKVGDQLNARGNKSADDKEITADEIVSGTFRSIPATVISTDAANNTITVTDLVTKRPVTLKVGPDSQMHQLPQMFAQRIAMRLKMSAAGGTTDAQGATAARPPNGEGSAPAGTGQRSGGSPDFQQMLNRMPSVGLGDLQKGSALMIVATEGTADSPSQVIILLSGVEPILTAASPRDASTILSPWNLSAGGNAGTGDAP